jgi:predicted ATPase/DNA-binding XRE family transcriptional regulator
LLSLGALLKRYRLAAGLTQEALAERAGLSTRAVSDLERGRSRAPRYDTLDLLAEGLQLPTEQRAALFAAARPALPPAEAHPIPPQVLPLPPTALLGREQELGRALHILRRQDTPLARRLLTLTGPVGVGKTRLALQIARELSADFAGDMAWIELAAIREPALVPQAIAQALRLREQGDQPPAEQVRNFLRDKRFLLLLDNFEQVMEAASFVAGLFAGCPHLQVLVTSRAPLRLRAEQQLHISPLSPAAATALFRERARQAWPEADVSTPVVAAICERVDHLPLAIELAAAHSGVLSPAMLLERLSNRLQVLHGGVRDLPERQRTMHEAIAWSYSLLGGEAQRCFRAFGVFSGGCTLAAAEAVCWDAESQAGLQTITALVDASLVQVERRGDGLLRYKMLEVIREYALQQLRTAGEEEPVGRRHARYYAQLAEQAEQVGPANPLAGEAQLEAEVANGRAALEWTYHRGDVALGLRLATWFGFFWMKRGQMREALSWLEPMLALDRSSGENAVPPALRSRARGYCANLYMHLGDGRRAEQLARERVALVRQSAGDAEISNALAVLGAVLLDAGNRDEAAACWEESYAAAERVGTDSALSLALFNLGEIARQRGDLAAATAYVERGLAQVRSMRMEWGIANMLTVLAASPPSSRTSR